MKINTFSSILPAFVIGAMILTGCSKVEKTRIRLDSTSSVTIPNTIDRYDLHEANSTVVTNDINAKLSEEGFSFDDVNEINIEALELNVTAPAGEDFRFCRSVSIYLTADGMQDTLIGWKSNPTRLETHPLFLSRSASNLKEYFSKANYSYKAVFQMRELYAEPITVTIKPIYFVNAEKEK